MSNIVFIRKERFKITKNQTQDEPKFRVALSILILSIQIKKLVPWKVILRQQLSKTASKGIDLQVIDKTCRNTAL